ncbi:MAG: hypothetical protein CFE32_07140 [Alphaproteobacteria bacterium PA3]|nr:MAG: hypothetical protein CFE32_07140 [Alphaproteobacteria bacterium PA3]
MSLKVEPLTLRQKIAARLAQTGRRLLGLETDRVLLEDKLDRLERQVSEILLHGRRTAQVESRIDQAHRQLVALEGRVRDVQEVAQAVPGIAASTVSLRNDIKQAKEAVQSSQQDIGTQTLSQLSELQGIVKSEGHTMATLIADHQTLSARTHNDVAGLIDQVGGFSNNTLSKLIELEGVVKSEGQGLVDQIANLEAQTQRLATDSTSALKIALNVLSEKLTSNLQRLDGSLQANHVQAIKSLSDAQLQLDELQSRSNAISESITSLSHSLAHLRAAQLSISEEHRNQLDSQMGEAIARLDNQAADITHAHKILLQQPIYLSPGINAVVRVGGWDGHPISVPTSHAAVIHGHYVNGAATGEPGVRAAIRLLVKEGMCAIDVGAHVGIHSVIMGFHVGDSGRLICFEPDPDLAAALSQTMLMNGFAHKAQVINAALADASARLAFFRTPHSPESTLFPAKSMTERDTIEVNVTSLDIALAKGTKVDFLKIDAEGAEARIYRGMQRVLRENKEITMIIEFAPEHFERAGEDPKAYLEMVTNDGFSLSSVEEPTGAIHPISITQALEMRTLNLLLQRK